MQADSLNTAYPLEVTIERESQGGLSGLTPTVALRDGATTDRYLDWSDMLFKTAGWTTKYGSMTFVERGHYVRLLDVSEIAPQVPEAVVQAEYHVDDGGDVVGDVSDELEIVVGLDDLSEAVWDELLSSHTLTGSTGDAFNLLFKGFVIKVGLVVAGSTEDTIETDLDAPDGVYDGSLVVLVVSGEGRSRYIRHQIGGSLELSRAIDSPPAIGSQVIIVSAIQERKDQMSVRGRMVLTNTVVLDQADFFEADNFNRVGGLTPVDVTLQVFYNNGVVPWTLVVGDAITDSLVKSGLVYFHEIQDGFYNVRFRPNTVGFWRLVLTYPVGERTVTLDFDVVGQFPAIESGLRASFTK